MAEVQWQAIFETGIEQIDDQHRELVNIMNRLDRALSAGDSEAIVESTLRSLVSFTARHLADEEAFMQEHGYLDLDHHRVLHHQINMRVTGMLNRVGSPLHATAAEILDLLSDWLVNHILAEDKKIVLTAKVSQR